MAAVAVLFARADSHYKTFPQCDVWDAERDARRWPGGGPVVAHPPCRGWGRLRHFAKPREDELALGLWAVDQVRTWGGVLEHPAFSQLWLARCLPPPGQVDVFGGRTFSAPQRWWGHQADKETWFYIVGAEPRDWPAVPLSFDPPTRYVAAKSGFRKGMPGWMPDMTTAEREKTPPEMAAWLVELASSCRVVQ